MSTSFGDMLLAVTKATLGKPASALDEALTKGVREWEAARSSADVEFLADYRHPPATPFDGETA
jgi:hypothetical protein